MKKNMAIILLLATMITWGGMWLSVQPQRAQAASFGAGVKSVQQGTGTESITKGTIDTVNVTITAVVMAKSVVRVWITSPSTVYTKCGPTIAPVLTSTLNLRLFMHSGDYNYGHTVYYTWQVIEYY